MTDKILATLSILGLIAFTAVVIGFVRELDLAVVVVVCLAMGIYFFWRELRGDGDGPPRTDV